MLDTVRRAGQVLLLLSETRAECGVTEIAEALNVSKSTAHALLTSLCNAQLVRRTPSRRYRLGWGLLGLSRSLLETTEVRVEAIPVMNRLVQRFGETVHLAVLDRFEVVYVEKREGTRAVRIGASTVGSRLLAHGTGVGKVLLAGQPWSEVEAMLPPDGLTRFTDHTICSPDALAAELAKIRHQGFAYDLEEVIPELCCVAAPIHDYNGDVVAAMSISVPAYRFKPNRNLYRQQLLGAVRHVAEQLGHFEAAL